MRSAVQSRLNSVLNWPIALSTFARASPVVFFVAMAVLAARLVSASSRGIMRLATWQSPSWISLAMRVA